MWSNFLRKYVIGCATRLRNSLKKKDVKSNRNKKKSYINTIKESILDKQKVCNFLLDNFIFLLPYRCTIKSCIINIHNIG